MNFPFSLRLSVIPHLKKIQWGLEVNEVLSFLHLLIETILLQPHNVEKISPIFNILFDIDSFSPSISFSSNKSRKFFHKQRSCNQ